LIDEHLLPAALHTIGTNKHVLEYIFRHTPVIGVDQSLLRQGSFPEESDVEHSSPPLEAVVFTFLFLVLVVFSPAEQLVQALHSPQIQSTAVITNLELCFNMKLY
jgi:hypothetical protein